MMIYSIADSFSKSDGIYTIAAILTVILAGIFAVRFVAGFRALRPNKTPTPSANVAGRYHPMLRLLADEDFNLVSSNPKLVHALRVDRRRLFRRYLRCLTKDYGRLLDGIRRVMVESSVDRPDLARALARNRALFALAVCRIEFRLAMHWAGVGNVDISGVVEAFDRLRDHAAALSAVPVAA
jgi:hypothetical protein